MLDVNEWMERLRRGLEAAFPGRLRFLGLQGSRARGEAREDSDIDAVVVLDRLDAVDLRSYRALLDGLPHRELACGFVCGWDELLGWEPFDLFSLYHDTLPIVGSLDALLPLLDGAAVERAVRAGACNLYHACAHNWLHGRSIDTLRELYKQAAFTIRAAHFQEAGTYLCVLPELMSSVGSEERELLETGQRLKAGEAVDFDAASMRLFEWSKKQIAGGAR